MYLKSILLLSLALSHFSRQASQPLIFSASVWRDIAKHCLVVLSSQTVKAKAKVNLIKVFAFESDVKIRYGALLKISCKRLKYAVIIRCDCMVCILCARWARPCLLVFN